MYVEQMRFVLDGCGFIFNLYAGNCSWDIMGVNHASSFRRGETSLFLKSNGTVWAWGYNGNGELGDGTTTNSSTPVQVLGFNVYTTTPSPSPTPTPTAEMYDITGTWKGNFEGEADEYILIVKFKQTDSNFTGSFRAKNKISKIISKGTLKGTLNENVDGHYLKFTGKQATPCKGRITKGSGDVTDAVDEMQWVEFLLSDCHGKDNWFGDFAG